MARIVVGTSGYSYKEWKGIFYPADLPAAKMLSFYAGHFGSVEINNTFYRMPAAQTLVKWAGEVPPEFTFVLKAPQWIMHRNWATGAEDGVRSFLQVASVLGPQLGPLLCRVPPNMEKDTDKLRAFLALIPETVRVVIEVRNDSWLDDAVYGVLREHDAALCISDTDEVEDPDKVVIPTASWGYLRLRRTEYTGADLAAWARRVNAHGWSDAYVFFKHEDEGKGPAFAKRFLTALR